MDEDFYKLSKAAFDVMLRRGWSPAKVSGGWGVQGFNMHWHVAVPDGPDRWPDPFTALVEADKWYRENVEQTK